MDLAIQLGSYLLWFPLEILTISAIIRTGIRRYPLVFSYMVVTLLIAIAEIPVAYEYYHSHRRVQYSWYLLLHSIGDGLTYTLILAVVISLIYRASEHLPQRRVFRRALVLVGLLVVVTSFFIHYDKHAAAIGIWMIPWTRDLNFCAAILDLILWALLLALRTKDHRLLLLTGGMGIMFTGEAIGHAVRNLAIRNRSHNIVMLAHVLTLLADLIFMYVWWQTFRKEAAHSKDGGTDRVAAFSPR
jgi:hypothetical protein